jgi:hypothetical protein
VNQILRLTLLLVALLALAGCGDDSNDQARAKALLSDAFGRSIGSANVTVDLKADLDGNKQFQQPVRIKLNGPYRSNGNGKLPDTDWDIGISGGGQTFTFGLLTTAGQAFIDFQGTSYTLGEGVVKAIERPPGSKPGESLTKRLGVNLLDWVRDAKLEDDADVAGVPTRHVRADLDVGKVLRGLNTIVGRAAGAAPQAARARLTDDQIDSVRKVVDDPRFDLYVGKADGKIRRLSIDIRFKVPEDARAKVGGLSGGTLTLDVELAAVGQPVKVEPPKDARPIAELTKQLGGLGVLGTLFGGKQPSGTTGGQGPSGSPPTSQQFQQYADCLDAAKPSDRAAIEKCAALLR